MTGYQKLSFIAGQLFFGFLFGFVGMIGGVLFTEFYSTVFDTRVGLFNSVLHAYVGGCIGLFIGTLVGVYTLYNRYNKSKVFWKSVFIGMVSFGICLISILYIAFPVIFIILFLNFRLLGNIKEWSEEG